MKNYKALFVHQNFPAQYKHLAPKLALLENFEVTSLSMKNNDGEIEGVKEIVYEVKRSSTKDIHKLSAEFETKILRAEGCANKAHELKKGGYYPDIIIGHTGWGELMFLKEVWPDTKYLSYVEFFYNLENSDIDFDPDIFIDRTTHTRRKLISRTSSLLFQYLISEKMITPMHFQKSTFPEILRNNIEVIHEGIDTNILKPNENAFVNIDGQRFTSKDKIVLFISRSLEPYRGYHSFIRSIPGIIEKHPDTKFIIIGGNQKGYGADPKEGTTHRENFFNEIKDKVDTKNIFFLGLINYNAIIACYQIATAHVYLTYPFVLSWSMLESMSCGGLVVGSNTGPVSEVINHSENGYLVDFFDYSDISSTVNKILDNPNIHSEIRENARQTIINNYDLDTVCIPKQIDLIKSILEQD